MPKYKIILADPPWSYKDQGCQGTMANHYTGMSLEDLKSLPVREIADKDCVLFLWTTYPMLREALEVIEAWGFCVGVGTKVLTLDLRYVPAESLRVGDKLVGFDEFPNGNRRYLKKATVISTGISRLPCYDITLESGKVLRCSEDHAWLMQSYRESGKRGAGRAIHWVKAKETQHFMDYHTRRFPLGLPILIPKFEPIETYESGFLSGAFDSEGHLRSKKPLLSFSQKDNALLAKVREYLLRFGFELSSDHHETHHRKINTIRINGGYWETLRFLMQMRPPRLLDKWEKTIIENMSVYNQRFDLIKSVKYVGKQKVVTLQTDTATYIAEGYGAHNTYKSIAFQWLKLNKNGIGEFYGLGRWTRGNTEPCLLATKGKPRRVSASVFQLIKAPRGTHSRKPAETRDKILQLMGDLPRIELFASEKVRGWDALGFEIDGQDIRVSLPNLIKT